MKNSMLLSLFAGLLIIIALGCVTAKYTERDISGLDRKLDRFTYIEEGDLVALIVCTHATRFREEDSYIPVEIAVANRGLNNLTLTRESFTLIDEQGNKYPLVPSEELLNNYSKQDFDNRLSHVLGVIIHKFELYTPVESNFAPDRFSRRIVFDKVELTKFSYTIDMIYFERPVTGLKGKKFELFLTASELEDPIFVKFMVE